MQRRIFREFNDEKWEEVRNHPHYAKVRENTIALADEKINDIPRAITFTDIHEYMVSGDRKRFESLYNSYTSRISLYFLAYLITLDEKYITPLSDAIWCVCDMESWSIPAHVSENLSVERRRRNLDLTSTILGFRISEVLYFIGDKLPELVRRRAEHEVRERVIESYAMYRNNEFWWYKATNNWSSVCIGATLCCYLYLASDEEIERELPRMLETIEYYLKGFNDDGCCLEGAGYWHYGFSHFCLFASMLRDYTDGKINLFDNPKVRKIAEFPLRIALNEKQAVNFSDANLGYKLCAWMMPFLKSVYPDIKLPKLEPPTFAGAPLRYILWQDPNIEVSEFSPKSTAFEDAQWFVHIGENYSLAAKAGHNSEPHNHNDIGSFVVSKNGKVTFCDSGMGEYTRQYFSPERYMYFVTCSRGHSVPIINGKYQCSGKEKSQVFRMEDGVFEFSMQNGYAEETLTSLKRSFECLSDKAVMTDAYEFTKVPESLTERFISQTPITLGDGEMISGDSVITFDAALFDASLGVEQVSRSGGKLDPVYYADLTVKAPDREMTFKFEIK